MIVYGPSLSPYVRKVLVCAAEKGIAVEQSTATRGPDADPAYLAASPFRKIPAIKDGDFLLSDSSAIVAYMDKLVPDPALIPSGAQECGRAIWFEEFADDILGGAVVRIFFNRVVAERLGMQGDMAVAEKAEKEDLPKAFAYLETVAPTSGFIVGAGISVADIAIASPCANLAHMGMSPDAKDYPKTAAYVARILARPSFATLTEAEKAFFS